MLSAFKNPKNSYIEPARLIYAALLERVRAPWFYKAGGVPDTFDGRFDVLLLHVFFIVNRLAGEGSAMRALSQALFDVTFADMDQTLREMGIGDMGVPKHMRRMMKAFNGRMHAYSEALSAGTMAEALRRNLFGTLAQVDDKALAAIEEYCRVNVEALAAQAAADIMKGRFYLAAWEEEAA